MKDDTGVTEMKKRSIVLLFLLIVFAIITTTYAFNVATISTTVEFVDSPRTNSDREVSLYEAYPLGKNEVYVKFRLLADPVAPQSDYVRVRIMPLDVSNNVLTSVAGLTTIQQKIDAGSWTPTEVPYATDADIVWENMSPLANTVSDIDIYVTFQTEANIAGRFVTCMIEISEYN